MGEYNDQRSIRNLHIWLFLTKLVFAEGEGEIADDGEVTYWFRRAEPSTKTKTKNSKNGSRLSSVLIKRRLKSSLL